MTDILSRKRDGNDTMNIIYTRTPEKEEGQKKIEIDFVHCYNFQCVYNKIFGYYSNFNVFCH